MIPTPPRLEDLPVGAQLIAGLGKSTVLADFDFETYSPAGYVWRHDQQKFVTLRGTNKKGLKAVGTALYVEHPEAEVLSMAYDLKEGVGRRLWVPGQPPPLDLFAHILQGNLLEAWNCAFEYWVWVKICIPKYQFPPIPLNQLRDAMAKSRAFGLPGGLEAAGRVLNISAKKDKDGKRLLDKFSIPRKPTAKDKRTRIKPTDPDAQQDALALYAYNLRDIEAEAEVSSCIPDLTPRELEFWQCDQQINLRGVRVDKTGVQNCIKIIENAYQKYNRTLYSLTDGTVSSATEIKKLKIWLAQNGIETRSLNSEAIDHLLSLGSLPDHIRRVLEIRSLIGSTAVKKVYSMLNQMTSEGKVHDLFIYHSARTGRSAGTGPQPQNLPNSGPEVLVCVNTICGLHFNKQLRACPWCGNCSIRNTVEWNPKAVEDAFTTINTGSLDCVEYFWGDAIATVYGCLRGLFISSPGHDLLCSDYSAIEAVVLAALAGEEWRMEVFRTHGKIYEMSASKITGIEFDEFLLHKSTTGQHHPMRKKVGKVAELASGYQGWIGAWKQFGADEFFSDDEIKKAVSAWRQASPAIVEMWGGQQKRWQPCYYGLEGAAVSAVLKPGTKFKYRAISYLMSGDVLYCQLPSERYIAYHRPRLTPSERREGTLSLSFEGWNTNPKQGPMGWIRMFTYGGKLTENVVQAISRDILANAIINLEKAGYPVVLHIHDEIVAEVPENFGSIEEFEEIMSSLPSWAEGWPVKANGGWRGKRYTK
jgi:DNA polymerase bacteriophage-type